MILEKSFASIPTVSMVHYRFYLENILYEQSLQQLWKIIYITTRWETLFEFYLMFESLCDQTKKNFSQFRERKSQMQSNKCLFVCVFLFDCLNWKQLEWFKQGFARLNRLKFVYLHDVELFENVSVTHNFLTG